MLVRVLGPVQVADAGTFVDAGTAKQSCVLAALVITHGRPVPVDTLVERVWGESQPASTRDALYQYLSRLRARGMAVRRTAAGYLLEVGAQEIDLYRSRSLAAQARAAMAEGDLPTAAPLYQQALALWRDTPLSGIGGDWAASVRETLVREHVTLLGERFDAELARGHHAEILPELSAAFAAQPLAERLAGQLMLALVRCGRTAEALECFTQIRQRVRDQLGVEPGPELVTLHQQVLRRDEALLTVALPTVPVDNEPTQPPAEPTDRQARRETSREMPRQIPRQLPADIAVFAGRDAELAALDELLSVTADAPRPVVISAVSGTAGVGKTALAVHWAHRVADRFPDGQLYVNLRGFDIDGRVTAPAEVIRGFLDALGVPPERIPLESDAQAALYRGLLTGRQVIIVLDNARDAEQVRPLLPGAPTAMVLVTSRNQLTGLIATEAAQPLTLDLLSPTEARALLTRRLGPDRIAAEPDAVTRIVDACARLPLALAITAARAHQTGFPLAAVADELDQADRRLDALDTGDPASQVRTVFSWSYETLKPPAARLFRLLGLHPGADLAIPAAASLADRPVAQVRRLLTELVRANMLAEHTPGRYTFHDLLRTYAADLTHAYDTGDERRDTVARLLDHYVDTADAAARLLYPEKLRLPPTRTGSTPTAGTAAEALVWLDAELSNMVAAAVHAAGSGPRRAAWLLADTLHGYLRARGAFSEWRTLAGAGLTAAEAEADLDAQAAIHLALSWLEWRGHGDPERAVWHCARAAALTGQSGWLDAQAAAMGSLATMRWRGGQLTEAVDKYHQALALQQRTGQLAGAAISQANLGGVYADLGDLTRSAGFTEQALELYRRVGARRGEAMCLADLAVTDHARGHLDKALDHANQALALHRLIGDRVAETETLRVVSEIHRDLGHDAEAITALATAVHQLEDLPDHIYQAELLNSLAAARHTLGDHPATVDYYQQAVRLALKVNDQKSWITALIGLASEDQRLDNHDQACVRLRRALAAARDSGFRILEGIALTALARSALHQGSTDQAIELARQAHAVHLGTGHVHGQADALRILADAGSPP